MVESSKNNPACLFYHKNTIYVVSFVVMYVIDVKNHPSTIVI